MRPNTILTLTLAALALSIAAAACAKGGNAPVQDSDATLTLFQRNCAVCHGKDGEGQQVGTLRVPALTEGRPLTDTDERLFAQISDGGGGMPPFKFSLTDEQIRDLVRFVREKVQRRAASQRQK